MAILPHDKGPLRAETKQQFYQEHRRGGPVEVLAGPFGRTGPGIRRIINEVRSARILGLPLDYIDDEQFSDLCSEKKAQEMLGPPPESDLATKKPRLPSGLPAYVASLYEVPLLTREQEAHLFRKMNYLKYQASKLREKLVLDQPKPRLMDRIETLFAESVATKKQIISANLRLVVSIAKRYVGPAEDFFELVSDGNLSLIRAVEKFDVSRGNRFSTYATWAVLKNFARSIPAVLRHRDRFRTSHSEMFITTVDPRADQHEQESEQLSRESHVKKILCCLDERELQIVTGRFGLTRGQTPLTLQQVGAAMGVSKERVRQIQTRAMGKLRKASEEDRVDFDLAIAVPAGNPLPNSRGTTTGGDQ
jgi:RNA polymerase primary sigma factor/RNA polymerase sigma factor